MGTDYTPGDPPVPVGSLVRYEYTDYIVHDHLNPHEHPHLPPNPPLEEAYPDGTTYWLWEAGRAVKMDNGQFSRLWVRRTSFHVLTTNAPAGDDHE